MRLRLIQMLVEIIVQSCCSISPLYPASFLGCGIVSRSRCLTLANTSSMTITLRWSSLLRDCYWDCFGFGGRLYNPRGSPWGFVSRMYHENGRTIFRDLGSIGQLVLDTAVNKKRARQIFACWGCHKPSGPH